MNNSKQRRAPPEKLDPPLLMRDLPAVQDLERLLLLYTPIRGERIPPGSESFIRQVSLKLFGITYAETIFEPRWPTDLSDDDEFELVPLQEQAERYYETSKLCDVEVVAVLQKYGIDFTDDRGQPLRCTLMLCRQAEAAFKGLAGQLPDRSTISLAQWSDNLGAEAKKFIANKKRGSAAGSNAA